MRDFLAFRDLRLSRLGAMAGGGGAFTARFGDASNNAAGTGAFDTSIYQLFPPADGTYGAFTVASGVITPSGAQTVGTYDVGGYPVQVVAGLKAVATQGQIDAVSVADAGKIILVREASGLTLTTAWNNGTDFNWATLQGDGPDLRSAYLDASKDARKHFSSINLFNTKKLIFQGLNVVTGSVAGAKVDAITINSSGGSVSDVQIRKCRVICSRPDPFGDYTGGVATFPGQEGILIAGTASRCGAYDNVILGGAGNTGCLRINASGWVEIVGNHLDVFYNDGIRMVSSETAPITGGNLMTRPMSLASDTGNPHTDGEQHYPGGKTMTEASAYVMGSCRGDWQSYFNDDGTTDGRVRDNVIVDDVFYQITCSMLAGVVAENNVWLPPGDATLPVVTTMGGVRFGSISATGTNVLQNSVFRVGSSSIDGSVTQSGNVNSQDWELADYNAAFPNWQFDVAEVPSLQSVLTVYGAPDGGGTASGKGPRVTFAGSERSSYLLNVAAPVISVSTPTPTSSGFTATLTTDTELNSVFWAVVTAASPTPTWREIKERRATGGVAYGCGWIGKGETTEAISDNSLSPSTDYELHCIQENGYSVQSNITTSAFTTDAASMSLVAVGATATTATSTLTLAVPSHVSGDKLVAFVQGYTTTRVPGTPSGWTLEGSVAAWGSASTSAFIFSKVAGSSEPATVDFVYGGGAANGAGCMASIRNAAAFGTSSAANTFSTTSRTSPSITAAAGSGIFHVWASERDITTPNAGDRLFSTFTGGNRGMAVELQLGFAGGATSARTATTATAGNFGGAQFELLKV